MIRPLRQNLSKYAVVIGAAFVPVAALADEALLSRYGPLVDACFAKTETVTATDCIGIATSACMEGEEGGETTLGMSMCNHAETLAWDAHLNAEYQTTMAWAKVADEDEAVHFPEYAYRAEKLRDAQRAWIAFRDAECGLDYALWGSGSMRHIAGTDCKMRLTGERATELRAMREMFQ